MPSDDFADDRTAAHVAIVDTSDRAILARDGVFQKISDHGRRYLVEVGEVKTILHLSTSKGHGGLVWGETKVSEKWRRRGPHGAKHGVYITLEEPSRETKADCAVTRIAIVPNKAVGPLAGIAQQSDELVALGIAGVWRDWRGRLFPSRYETDKGWYEIQDLMKD